MAQQLLAELHQRGIRLRLADGNLRVLAPQGALTPELRERLQRERDDLIALLRRATPDESPPEITAHPRERYEPFPLTDLQHAYWVGRSSAVELGGTSCHYYFELEGEGLDLDRLTASLRKVIARHDMLRAIVSPDGRQRILPEVPGYEIAVTDLRERAAETQAAELARMRADMDHQVLPAHRWPLFDIRASRLDDRRLRLHVSLDVLIMDGLSLYLMFRDWRRFYEQPDWAPEPLSLSYRDYVLHEQAARDGSGYRADEEYWLGRLDSLPPPPGLPLATQPAQLSRPMFTRRQARVPRERWGAIKEVARQRGLTPSSVLMAAFADVLRTWSAQDSFTLNLTLFNRPPLHPEIGDVVGDFTSVTLLAVQPEPKDIFAVRTERIQQQVMRDLEHLAYTGVRVLRERGRRLGGGPGAVMPVVFTSSLFLASAADEDLSDGIRFFGDQVYSVSQTPQVWLDHQVTEVQDELVYSWDAVDELFPDRLLDDMFACYGEVLDGLSRDESAWDRRGTLATLPDWQMADRADANDTDAPIPACTLPELVEAQARVRPDATAVIAGDQRLTYQELLARARQLARRLGHLAVPPNTLVGVVLDKGWEQVAAVLGIGLSGAAYLPIDPQWPAARRSQLLEIGDAWVVVTTARLRDELAWPVGTEVVTLTDPEVLTAGTGPLGVSYSPEDLAYVIFTSGSTGEPKGVAIDHRGAANTVQDINQRFEVGPGDRVLALSALSFDLSVYDIFGILAAGGAVVMPSPGTAQDPAHWTSLAERHAVTVWNSVPALMQAWLDGMRHADGPPGVKLRLVLLSGDWIPVGLADAVRNRQPDARVISLGGATESSIWSIFYPIGEVPRTWVRIPYGKPLANQTLHVFDERLEPCPVWTAGEIFIGGVGVARGYWADPRRTAERFIIHPVTFERLYCTGDIGRYLPGGDIEFLGRRDSQVKINGYRIELGEITAALERQPGVGEAVVDVATNPRTGRRHLVAHVVPTAVPGGRPGHDDLVERGWLSATDGGAARLRRGLTELEADLTAYHQRWQAVEELCPAIIARALTGLGLFQSGPRGRGSNGDDAAGEEVTGEEIVARCAVKPGYRGLVGEWLRVLAVHGLLRAGERAGGYRRAAWPDAGELDARIRDTLADLAASSPGDALMAYIVTCADHQIQLLRGEISPLQLLLGGDSRATEALYATNAIARLQNAVTAAVVRSYVDAQPADRAVRILEVGAGTGATSAEVLRELPTGRVRYLFSDVSRYFTDRARDRFHGYPFVEYAVLDIDRAPGAQGVEPGSVDVVLAANVMHDAKDLDQSLAHLRIALVPGGLLVLLEGTSNALVHLVTVRFIEGLAQDRAGARQPLLSVPQWQAATTAAGFVRFAAIPDGPAGNVPVDQHVLVAQAPGGTPRVDSDALRQALEGLLPEYMVPRHYTFIDRLPLSANGKVDRSALPPPWADADEEEHVGPRDEMERKLLEIWQEALERDDFGVADNFFELGGDSLHAVNILGRLRDEFGLDATAEEGLEFLFDHPTIAELALALREQAAG
jgi:amino acid adenylation domain-containing protein